MIKMEKGYHKFVFDIDNRKFVGEFDKMYKAETTEGFNFIVNVGCGNGALTLCGRYRGEVLLLHSPRID